MGPVAADSTQGGNTMPLDHTLKALENIADSKGLQLEDVPGYIPLCSFLTDLELYGTSSEFFSKEDCLKVLKALIAYVAPSLVGCEMEFHLSCQP